MNIIKKLKYFMTIKAEERHLEDVCIYSDKFISNRLNQINLAQSISNDLVFGSVFADILYTKHKNISMLADHIENYIKNNNKASLDMFLNYKIYCQDEEDKKLLINIIKSKYYHSFTQNEIDEVMAGF